MKLNPADFTTIALRAPDGEGTGAPASSPAPAAAPAPASDPAPAPAAPSAEPAAPAMVQTQIGDIPADIQALFDHNPFAAQQPATPAAPLPAAPTTPPADPAATPAAPAAVSPAAPPAQPAADPNAQTLATIAQVLASQQQTLQQVTQQTQQLPQPAQPDVEIPQHGYQFTIPEPLVAAIASENPVERGQAIQALMMTTARTVHQEVVRSMRAEVARAVPNLIQGQIQEHQRRQAVFQDFYGTYPQFSDPRLRSVVVQTAQALAAQHGHQGWNAQLRDQVAQHLTMLFAAVGGQPQQATPAAALPAAPLPAAPAIVTSTARPAAPAVNTVTRDIQELMFG